MSYGPQPRNTLQYARVGPLMQASTTLSQTPADTVQPESKMSPPATPAGLRGAAAASPALHSGSSQGCHWPAGWQNSGGPTAPGGRRSSDQGETGPGGKECRQAGTPTGWIRGPTLSSINMQQAGPSRSCRSRWWQTRCTDCVRGQAGTDRLNSGTLKNAGSGNPPEASHTNRHSVLAVQAALISVV